MDVLNQLDSYLRQCERDDAEEEYQEQMARDLVEEAKDAAHNWLSIRDINRKPIQGLHQTNDLFAELCTDDDALLRVDDILCMLLIGDAHHVERARLAAAELFLGLAKDVVERDSDV